MARALTLVPLLLAAAALFDASDAEALSCQRRIISRGDPMAKVVSLCGQPAQQTQRLLTRSQTVGTQIVNGQAVFQTISATVAVSKWVYDFGPQRLMRELTFEDGVLVRIRTLGRGGLQPAGGDGPTARLLLADRPRRA